MDSVTVTREDVENYILNVLKEEKKLDVSKLSFDSTLKDLNIDSFGFLEVIFSIEHQFNIHFPNDLDHVKTAKDVVDETYSLIQQKNKAA
ncbi:MAG TPA: phosphopantetheine-binding protein [Methylotenera sp.]|nr:phosphopantetheine-binding protein [Methylotenera sp.]HPH05204.1 phosphopantetheine-binding protein [Methylotenera sp.]HPN00106.1 phosphopantetheine-binding protein [Methylotenera sp.]